MGRLLLVEQIDQRVSEAELRIGILPLAGDPRVSNQGIISPEDQRKSIKQE
jgi:hypothetical protein